MAQYGTKTFGTAAAAVSVAVGCGLWLTGMWFESVGDWQLARFQAGPANRGRLLTTGLRRYTRHPNYFGDACVWWGLFAVAASARAGALTVLSPLLDAHLAATRPDFAAYAARTSGFLPRPPRRSTEGRAS